MSVKLAIGYGLREGPFIVHRVKLAAALFKLVGLYSALWMTEDNAAVAGDDESDGFCLTEPGILICVPDTDHQLNSQPTL